MIAEMADKQEMERDRAVRAINAPPAEPGSYGAIRAADPAGIGRKWHLDRR